jgi:membrane associated rhomboid family serine protease
MNWQDFGLCSKYKSISGYILIHYGKIKKEVTDMIPLRDSTRSRTFPFVTVALILINLYIYFIQFISSSAHLDQIILSYSFIPANFTERLSTLSILGILYLPFITAVFLHGSWFHVIFNMLYLWIFGDNIEDKLGHFRFLLFYLFAGIMANLVYYLTAPNSTTPLIGASGAIAGVLGAYFITFPKAKITTLFFIFFFVFIRKIHALYFLLIWIVIQVFNGITTWGIMGSSVAWWAHIGGFLAGLIVMPRTKRLL